MLKSSEFTLDKLNMDNAIECLQIKSGYMFHWNFIFPNRKILYNMKFNHMITLWKSLSCGDMKKYLENNGK